MTDLGLLCSYLGIKVQQCKSKIALSPKPCVMHILDSFKMVYCNPTNTPLEARLELKKEEGGGRVDAML